MSTALPLCCSPSNSESAIPRSPSGVEEPAGRCAISASSSGALADDDDQKLIPTLFRASVLLSAQDDYYDNPRISAAQKESFCAATNRALRTNSFQPVFEGSVQLGELSSLWADIAETIPRSAPQVRSYWIEKACQLNEAMAAENRAVMKATITYDGYMSTAIQSIGMVFIWATYLAHKHVAVTTLREMDPVLLAGCEDRALEQRHRELPSKEEQEERGDPCGRQQPGISNPPAHSAGEPRVPPAVSKRWTWDRMSAACCCARWFSCESSTSNTTSTSGLRA